MAFDYMDKDGSGTISATEIREVMRRIGIKDDDRTVAAIMKDGDKDSK